MPLLVQMQFQCQHSIFFPKSRRVLTMFAILFFLLLSYLYKTLQFSPHVNYFSFQRQSQMILQHGSAKYDQTEICQVK